jgi:hypothetical protein
MKFIPKAPKYSTCWYCLEKVEGSHNRETEVRYSCTNHKPLYIDWYCQRRSYGNWYFNNIIIYIPDHFRLLCPIEADNPVFHLDEYKPNDLIKQVGSWRSFQSKTYPIDWVLTQSPKRLLSLLQIYKTFS